MSVKKHNTIHLNIISIKYWPNYPLPYSLGPKQIKRMLTTQEIKTTLPLDFPEWTNEGHSAPAYNTLLVSDAFIIGKLRITRSSFYNFNSVLLIILIGNLPSNFYHMF